MDDLYNNLKVYEPEVKGMSSLSSSTPMETQKPLLKDEDGEEVDVHMYRLMICPLMYLTSSRPDIMFVVCACARYQVNPKVSHLHAVERIFRLISWQCKKQTVVANSITEVEYVAASSCCGQSTVKAKTINGEVQLHALVDGKKIIVTESTVRRDLQVEDAEGIDCLSNSTIFEQLALMGMVKNLDNVSGNFLKYPRVGKGFFGRVTPLFPTMVVQNQVELGEGSAMPTDPHHTPTIIESSTQPQKTQKPRKPKRKDTQVPQPSGPTDIVADEAIHKELGDNLVRAASTTSSLEVVVPSAKKPWGIQLLKLGLRMYLSIPMIHYSQEKTKTTQANEIDSLKRRVKKLKKKRSSRTYKLKRLYKVGLSARVESSRDEESLGEDASKQGRRINVIDADEDITLVNVQDDAEMFDVNTLTGDEVFAEQEVATKDVNLTIDEDKGKGIMVEELVKSVKPKVKGIVIQDPSITTTTTTTTIISSQQPSQDKGKGIIVQEPVKPMKKKVQIMLDEEIALKLQAEIDEEERISKDEEEKIDEANIAWDDIQVKVDANYQLVERLQAGE
ncbi:hypothetical protein Tco_0796521 [Tanacetum coccineum]